MDAIKPTATRVNQTQHFVRIEGAQLQRIVAAAVAEAAGLTLDDPCVTVDRCWISRENTSTGTEARAEVRIVVDHEKQPKSSEWKPFSGMPNPIPNAMS